jgi:hypothetical protein
MPAIANSREGRLFSRFQLYWLHELEEDRALAIKVWSGGRVEAYDRVSWIRSLELNAGRPNADQAFLRWLELVILLQNKYLPGAQGHRNMSVSSRYAFNEAADDRYLQREYLPRVARDGPLKELGLTLKQAQQLRIVIGLRIQRLDPLARWYPLVRLARDEERKKLGGSARLAQELYLGDRILEQYFAELTGEIQHDAEDLMLAPTTDRRSFFYGRRKDYRDPGFLDMVLTQFGLHPARRAVLFVEGDTEDKLYTGIAGLIGYDLDHLNVEVQILHGVDNADRTVELLRYLAEPAESGLVQVGGKERVMLRRPPTFTYLWIDRENSAKKQKLIAAFRKARPDEFLRLWDPDLERANFTATEIARGLSPLVGRRVSARAVNTWLQGKGNLEAWVSQQYGVSVSKPALVPYYLRLLDGDLRRARRKKQEPTRPVLQLVRRMLKVVIGVEAFVDPQLEGKVMLGN